MDPTSTAGTDGITAAAPPRVFLSHTSDLGGARRGGVVRGRGVDAVLRARHAVTDMAYFAARDVSLAAILWTWSRRDSSPIPRGPPPGSSPDLLTVVVLDRCGLTGPRWSHQRARCSQEASSALEGSISSTGTRACARGPSSHHGNAHQKWVGLVQCRVSLSGQLIALRVWFP